MGWTTITFKPVDFPHGSEDIELARQWLPRAEMEARLANPFRKPYAEDGARCWRLWRSAVVNWDGGYAPCFYLTDASDDFGDVRTHSVKEIWNNEQYRTARRLFQKSGAPKAYVGCIGCIVYADSKAAKFHKEASLPQRNATQRNGHKPVPRVPVMLNLAGKDHALEELGRHEARAKVPAAGDD